MRKKGSGGPAASHQAVPVLRAAAQKKSALPPGYVLPRLSYPSLLPHFVMGFLDRLF